MASFPTLHDASTVCAERIAEVGLNTFEEGSADPWPGCGSKCDVFSQVNRGAITKGFNVGLTHQQSKALNVDVYNQGCSNPWGCVSNGEFSCRAPESRFGPYMDSHFKELNKAYDPSGTQYHPPQYMMGIKNEGINSVTGWKKATRGDFLWKERSENKVPCPEG
jgi:hypothetical protein